VKFISKNDKLERFFLVFLISNAKKGKESGIAERQRESVCERQSIAIGEK
jgi:hypothetical protein